MTKKRTENARLRFAAASLGETKYQPQEPCPTCEDKWRYVLSNQCVSCTKVRTKKNNDELRNLLKKARRMEG